MARTRNQTLHEEREKAIYKACKTPKTISDLAKELDATYATMHRHVNQMTKQGRLVKSLFTIEGSNTYTSIDSDQVEVPPLTFWVNNNTQQMPGSYLIKSWGREDNNPGKIIQEVAGAVAHLYIRAAHLDSDLVSIDPKPVEVRQEMGNYLTYFKNIVSIIEQLLVKDLLWADDPRVLALFKELQENEAFSTLDILAAQWRERLVDRQNAMRNEEE